MFVISAAKDTLISATRCMMGVELSQISLLYFLSYINAAGSLQQLYEATEKCGQELKINVIDLNFCFSNRFHRLKLKNNNCKEMGTFKTHRGIVKETTPHFYKKLKIKYKVLL